MSDKCQGGNFYVCFTWLDAVLSKLAGIFASSWFFCFDDVWNMNFDQALYRAAKASLSLNLLAEAKSFCEKGLEHDPNNKELKMFAEQIDLQRLEHEQREAQVSRAVAEAKV